MEVENNGQWPGNDEPRRQVNADGPAGTTY